MTRETKLGLAVAGSFLALVGGVLAVKLHQGGLPSSDADTTVAQTPDPTPPPGPNPDGTTPPSEPAATKIENIPPAEAVADADRTKMPQPLPEPTPPVAQPVNLPPVVQTVANQPQPEAVGSKNDAPPPPSQPTALGSDPPPPQTGIIAPDPDSVSLIKTASGSPATPPAPAPAPVLADPAQLRRPRRPPRRSRPPQAPMPAAPAASPPPAPESMAQTPAPTVAPVPDMPAPPPVVMPPAPPPEPPKAPEVKPDTITFGKPAGSTDTAPTPPPPAAPSLSPPAPLSPSINQAAAPTVAVIPERPAGGTSPSAALDPPRSRAVPRDTFAAPARPLPEPKAQSYLEEQYRWQPGDTFEGVSQRFYYADKYAAALLKYNQEYPLAGQAMRRQPPTVVPGQVIWVPPTRILERDHGVLIAGHQPLGTNGLPVTPTSQSGESVVTPVGPPPSAPGSQLYRVRSRGETLYEIARRTLNDSGRWYQIYRLNPALSRDPKLPIPEKTVLRLPSEARVDPTDRP